jgi:hypothetical protein
LNRYAYCRNNPIDYADPSGLGWKSFWNKVGDFFSGIGQGIAANPGAFVAGLAVGIFAAWAIAPMISGLSGAMAASGAGVTFWEGFVLGGMKLGIPAFSGTLAGGLAGGEKFSTALKNAAIVGGATFVTAGLIEGSYASGWQDSWHFTDTRLDELKHYNNLSAEGRLQEALDYKNLVHSKHVTAYQGYKGVHTGISIEDNFGDYRGNWGFNPANKDSPLIKARVLAGETVPGKVYSAIEGESYTRLTSLSNDFEFIRQVHIAIQVSMQNPPAYNLYLRNGGIRCDEWVKQVIEQSANY